MRGIYFTGIVLPVMLVATASSGAARMSDGQEEEAPMSLSKENDDTTPIGALRALYAAIEAGDKEEILRLIRGAKTERQRLALHAYVDAWVEAQGFHNALENRFGREQIRDSFFYGFGMSYPSTLGIKLDEAEVEIMGDTAVVIDARHKDRPPSLIRRQPLIREGGRWKALFNLEDEEEVKKFLEMDGPFAEAMRQTAPELREGKYNTLEEVKDVFQQRALDAGFRNPGPRRGAPDDCGDLG